jgi:hypothetical protein
MCKCLGKVKKTWNLQVVTKVRGERKSKKWPYHKFGAIIIPFENYIIYNEEDVEWRNLWKILFVVNGCVLISIVKNHWL